MRFRACFVSHMYDHPFIDSADKAMRWLLGCAKPGSWTNRLAAVLQKLREGPRCLASAASRLALLQFAELMTS